MSNTFETSGDRFALHFVQGYVANFIKNFENRNNYYNSATHIHDKIFLNHNGQQTLLELKDWDVGVMNGNELLVIWIIKNNNDRGPYVAIKNLTTGSVYIKDSVLDELSNKPKPMFPEGADYMQIGCLTIVIIIVTLGIGYLMWYINYNRKYKMYVNNKILIKNKINDFIKNYSN